MTKDPASPNWAFLSRYDIIHDGELYLRRWRIFECPLFGIYIHKICRPDRDRDLHDHPWPFISFLLKGRYVEEVPYPPFQDYIQWISIKSATDSHRIMNTPIRGPVWTLVLRGRRQRVWGFHTENGWVPWNEYLGNKK